MNVKVEIRSQEAWRRVLAIEVAAEDVAAEYDRVARQLASQVRIPGFRKGKVPTSVVRKSFKQELDREFLEKVVPAAFGRALEETKLDPVSEPKFEELSFGEDQPLSFTADFECRPEITIDHYKGIAAEKEIPEVPDKAIEDVLEDFRKSRAAFVDVQRPSIAGDVLTLDYQAVDSAGKPIPGRNVKDYKLELGAGQVVEAFEQAVLGANSEDVRVAEISLPSDPSQPDLGGTTHRYRIKVRKVQEKSFPTLDDALVAAHTDVQTLAELKDKVREELEGRADRAGTTRVERILLERVVDANPFEPPDSLVEGLLEETVHRAKHAARDRGEDPELVDGNRIKEEQREGARREIRRLLVIDLIAKQESIETTEEELRARVEALARMQGVSVRKLIQDLGGDRFLRRLSREIRDKKVLAFLVQNAEISPKSVRLPES